MSEMDMLKKTKILNCCCSSVTQGILIQAMGLSGLRWKMNPAQVAAIQVAMGFSDVETVSQEVSPDEVKELLRPLPLTLFGIPVSIEDDFTMSEIHLLQDEMLILKIQNLSIPTFFYNAANARE